MDHTESLVVTGPTIDMTLPRLIDRSTVRAVLAALLALASVQGAGAALVPTGFQEYYVLGHEEHVYDFNNRPVLGQTFVGYTLSGGMKSVVSITASSDNQIVYYDQWEDGYEADLLNPAPGTTLVLGDKNNANGRACDYIATLPCTGNAATDDLISRGQTLNLASINIPGTPAAPNCAAATPDPRLNCVPIPRSAADIRFDGGDRIISSGGPVTLVHVQEPTANAGGVLGGAVEVLPRQAVTNATSYSVPIGEDTFGAFGGNNTAGQPFRWVDLGLVAFEDNTAVQVTSPGAGTVNFVLNRGQHWTSRGRIDLTSIPALTLTINAGTKVSVSKPIAGMIFASGTAFYATRSYALLPDLLHSNDYVITAPGDNAAVNGNSVHDLYIYNPDPANAIVVTATDTVGTTNINVAANSVVAYSRPDGANRAVPSGSTVRLFSPGKFWGITAYDSRGTAFDWGHSWLATDFLTTTYTVPYAPDNPGRTLSPPSAAAAPGSVGSGAMPAFVSATADNTCVRVDFDNDLTFDQVRRADGTLLPFSGGTCTNGYLLNALQSLRIYDNNAGDGTPNNDVSGARVDATKPVALAYGVDTDASRTSGVGLLDLGYAIYPVDQRFLNPVLTLDKTTDVSSVPANLLPGEGTIVTYSIEVRAYEFAPLFAVNVVDLLPAQASSGACVQGAGPGNGYVCNSTTITYPDLSTETGAIAEPGLVLASGRTRLTWDAALFAPKLIALQKNERLLIRYQVRIEGGGNTVLRNDAVADAKLGLGSVFFTPTVSADVVRTDVSIAKSVIDDGSPEANDLVTYTLTVSNAAGGANESGITVTDPLPANVSFEPGSITTQAPFTGTFSASQNAVVWSASGACPANCLVPGASATLTFQARINPLAASGTEVDNTATYESAQTSTVSSNQVTTTVVAPDLGGLVKTIIGNPAVVHPGETITYEVVVRNTGAAAASNVLVSDPISSLATYVPGSIQWRLNAGAFNTLTDGNDGVEASGADGRAVDTGGPPTADLIELRLATLGAGEDLTLRFKVTADAGTGGQTLSNTATVQAGNFSATDSSLVQVPIVGDATVTGHVFLDFNDNGVQNAGEPNLANVDVVVTDSGANVQVVSTDAGGNYSVVVPPGSTSVDVSESDPDFPAGATLCTAAPAPPDGCIDPQSVTAVSGNTVAARNVGYVPQPVTVSKISSAGGTVSAGQTVTYTITATNNSGANQGNVSVTDPLPIGTTYVGASTQVSAPSLRVTEYPITATAATTLNLALSQPLASNYFVIVRGSDGDGTNGADKGPDENYFALTGDPTGKGDLTNLGTNTLRFVRHNNVDGWTGVVTVVESLPNAGADGFTLRSVERVAHTGTTASGTDTSATPWVTLSRVMLMGGYKGAGCDTAESDSDNTHACHARLFPSGAQSINWTRDNTAGGLSTATSTVMVIEWGANWTVQRVRVQGNNGGNGIDATNEYNTSAIASVARARTWVWGTGHTNDNGAGDSAEGVVVTLGNGVNQNANETLVAAGIEFKNNAVDFEVWALTHPQLDVAHVFKPDGDSGAGTLDVVVPRPAGATRMALVYNGLNETGNNFPRSIFSARHLNGTTVRLQRGRSNDNFPAWVQSVDFTGLTETVSGGAPPTLASGYELPNGTSLTVTFQVTINGPPGVGTISNNATFASTQVPGGVNASVSDTVVTIDVGVEPNGAGSVLFNALPQTFSFTHTVTNRASVTDSYVLRAFSNLDGNPGWKVELIDPVAGVPIATDANGDGIWDGGATPNTGSLAPGASRSYRIRVTVPGGTAVGVSRPIELRATSDLNPAKLGAARDTLSVVDPGAAGAADVLVTPDNAAFVPFSASLESVAYVHTVTNNTGAARAFQLQAHGSQGYATRVYQDTNGDGVYTAGVDVQITQTASLANGTSQRIFVVVDVPASTAAGTIDTTTVTASFFSDNGTPLDPSDDLNFGGTATDTTTVTPAGNDGNNALGFTLSGGGTKVVTAGSTAVYPGQLTNIGTVADTYAFTLSASRYADGLAAPQPDDGLPHTTQLVLDTNNDGVINGSDFVAAVDTDGDGNWDLIDRNATGVLIPVVPGGVPGSNPTGTFDANGDGIPDRLVAAGTTRPYEIRRPVDPAQGPYSDPVTLTVTSFAAPARRDSVTATTSVQVATLAVIGDLIAYMHGASAVVQWSTRSEHGTVGFTLERRDERKRHWHPVNDGILPALLHSRLGGVYRLVDTGVRAGDVVTYRLLELEATGNVLEHGPYTVVVMDTAPADAGAQGGSDRPLPGYERVMRAMDTLAGAREQRKADARMAAALQRAARRGPVIKIAVRATGLYRLSADRLAEVMGLPLQTVRSHIAGNRLVLTLRGERVATLADGDDALLFYGEAIRSQYTRDNVYVLGLGRGLRMSSVHARTPVPVPGQTDAFTAHAEGNRYHLTHLFDDPDGDYWMWDFRFENLIFGFNDAYFPIATPHRASGGSATVTVRFHGGLEALHRARVALNGDSAGAHVTHWQGLTPHTLTFQVDASALVDGENRIEVTGLGSGDPQRPSTFYINDVDITYPRRLQAVDGALQTGHGEGGVTSIDGFPSPGVLVLDVSVPTRPRLMNQVTEDTTPAGTRVSVAPRGDVRQVLAVAPQALRSPTAMIADTPSVLARTDHRVDWLLITSADMMQAADVLAAHRRAQGLRTLVIDIEDVYDEFAFGIRDADAIWSLLRYAHDHWSAAPRYVVLAGEGSFDYKNHLGHGDSIIPTLLAPTGNGLFPSDNLFADVAGNDFIPEMAIGRLPVIDAEELEAVANKIIGYEASGGDWTAGAVFGADPEDGGGDFVHSSEQVLAAIPEGAVTLETLYMDPLTLPSPIAREQLHASLNAGRAFFNFFGHASSGSIGNLNPGLLNAGDLLSPGGSLANGANLPVVTAFTCLVGQFGFPGSDGLGELLLVAPERGAAAVFSPSGLSQNHLAERLGKGFYAATYADGELVIGEAILKAQRDYARSAGNVFLLDIYNLLGDPATIMK